MDETVLIALDRLAKETDRSRDWLVKQAIEVYVAGSTWQIDLIHRGIAEADAGAFASEDDVAQVRAKFAPSANIY